MYFLDNGETGQSYRTCETNKRCRQILYLLALLSVYPTTALSQSLASMSGTVTDLTGAVAPGAKILLVDTATEARRETASDQAGRYSFPQVPPGAYRLQASLYGFAEIRRGGIRLLVNQPATIDIVFERLGALTETVSVVADAAMVNMVDASLGNAVGTRAILQLPLEARNVAALLALQPGVAYIGNREGLATDKRNGSVAGGRSDQANVTLDGVDVNDQQNGYAFTSVLRNTLDSVQEFRVTTVNPTAEQGRSSGAQIALVTKSGSNAYHGALYHFHRNTLTTANDYFANAVWPTTLHPQGIPRPKLIRNIFGVSLGAPARKNRIFYFLNYEGRRDSREDSVVRTVPSESLRQGIVEYQNTDGGVSVLTPDDIRTRIDPLGIGPNRKILEAFRAYPAPNSDEIGDGLNTRGFRFSAPSRVKWDTYIGRLDTYLDPASKHSVFVRGNLQNDRVKNLPQFPGQPPASLQLENSKGLAVGYNAVFSPGLIASTRYGFTRQGLETVGSLFSSFVAFRGIDMPFATARSLARIVPVHQVSEEVSWIKRAHNVRFGGVIRIIRNRRRDYGNSYHRGSFNDSWLLGTGRELREPLPNLATTFNTAYSQMMTALLGIVSESRANYNFDLGGKPLPTGTPQKRIFAAEEYEMYIQDTWNVRRGLNVTAGLRWSLMPPVYEQQGYQTTVIPNLHDWFNQRGVLAAAGHSQAEAGRLKFIRANGPEGRDLYPFHKRNFSPRLALAYSPQASQGWLQRIFGGPGKTTLRAGASILYDVYGQGILNSFNAQQLGFTAHLANPAGVISISNAPRFTGFFDVPPNLPEAPPAGFPAVPPANGLSIATAIDDKLRPPYTLNFSLAIARELPHGFFVEGSYVSRLGRRLLASQDMAMPTNLRDPKSGQTYFEAAQVLTRASQEGRQIEQVGPVPFWENMFPDAVSGGLTATQNFYKVYSDLAPDYLTALYVADIFCSPACSRLGPYAMFNDQYSSLAVFRSVANSAYHSMQWTVRKRYENGYQFDVNYTLSKATDWASSITRDGEYDVTGFIVNAWFPRQNIAVSDWDIRRQFNLNGIFELPFGKGKRWGSKSNRGVNALVGGWQLGGVWYWTSGLPSHIYNGRAWPTQWNVAGYGTPTGPLKTEMGVFKNAPAIAGPGGPNIFSDPQAAYASHRFSLPGETGVRNTLRGDGFFTVDLSLNKRFRMPYAEDHSFQVRWEVFNVTNTSRFDVRSIADQGNNFLTISSTFGKYTGVLTRPRVMQFGLRYEF